MRALAFPVLGILLVYGVVVPTSLALVRWLAARLAALRSAAPGSERLWALTVLAWSAPVAWFASAALRQTQARFAWRACLYDAGASRPCYDAAGLAVLLLAVPAVTLLTTALRSRRFASAGRLLPECHPAVGRLRRLCTAHPVLRALRIEVVHASTASPALCTVGALRPRVRCSLALLERLDDEALRAALLHEAAHVRARDPLRMLLAATGASFGPLAHRMAAPLLCRWRLLREIDCDRTAVRWGADPAALAEAIVAASRAAPSPQLATSLGEGRLEAVRLRVLRLLMEPTASEATAALSTPERKTGRSLLPRVARDAASWLLPACVLLAAASGPLLWGSGWLDVLHRGIELAVQLLLH